MIFKRKVYDELLDWKKRSNGKTAALIEGARRIGKTTVATQFAKNEYRSFIILDFNNLSKNTQKLFDNGIGRDFDRFFTELQLSEGINLHERESVVIFDEVQNYPKARQLIKYFVEDGRYDYIETGSLISLKRNIENITIPSEEYKIRMHPMDFEEFLWAKGDTVSIPITRKYFEEKQPLGNQLHRVMMGRYREYMAVGGMPQAVSAFIEKKNYADVDAVKNTIWDLYDDDIEKIPRSDGAKASTILSAIPAMLGKKNKKFSPGMVKKDSGMVYFFSSLHWLEQARIVNICTDVTDPSPILGLSPDIYNIKTYIMDIGMLVTKSIRGNRKETNKLYKSIIFDKLSINEGMYFENMVAQELVATGHELYFHLFQTSEKSDTYEIDFLLSDGKRVIPIEVKSSNSKPHVSLDYFMEKYGDRCKEGYVIHSKDLAVEGNITYIPIYMTMFIE